LGSKQKGKVGKISIFPNRKKKEKLIIPPTLIIKLFDEDNLFAVWI
jgi:hypothetical protein